MEPNRDFKELLALFRGCLKTRKGRARCPHRAILTGTRRWEDTAPYPLRAALRRVFRHPLNANHVEFVVVGAYALAFHGVPRFTGDLDLLVHPSVAGAARVLQALDAFGFGSLGFEVKDFSVEDRIAQLGVPPVRIDIMTSITGIAWDRVWETKVEGHYDDLPVFFLGKSEFIANKQATGRPQDLADVAALEQDPAE
jgi:hypothetical protein